MKPSAIAIDTLAVTAPSAIEARRLADALPTALARASAHAQSAPTRGAERIDAGQLAAHPHTPGLADRLAERIVAAAHGSAKR